LPSSLPHKGKLKPNYVKRNAHKRCRVNDTFYVEFLLDEHTKNLVNLHNIE